MCVCSVSLKHSLSLSELEQQVSWVRAQVEGGSSTDPGAPSHRPLTWYMMADEESTLADQVRRVT